MVFIFSRNGFFLGSCLVFFFIIENLYGDDELSRLMPSQEVIDASLDKYVKIRGLERAQVTTSTKGILNAPYISCKELLDCENLQRVMLSKIENGEPYEWLFATYVKGIPWARLYISCDGADCSYSGSTNGPSIGSAMYAELIELWIEQKNAAVLMVGCSKCMSLIHIPNVDETNLTPISDGCAPMMEENYPGIRKSQLEIYLSQFGELTAEQRKQKILEFFSDDTPGLSKTQLQQSTLNKLNHVGDIRENIMKHHEIYNR